MTKDLANPDNKKDPTTRLIEKVSCGICRALRLPVCKGHGAGGGGSSSGSGKSSGQRSPQSSSTSSQESNVLPITLSTRPSNFSHQSMSKLFDFREIANLIQLNVISIENNSDTGTFRIKAIPGLTKAQKKILAEFFVFIKTEFEKFKEELAKQGIFIHDDPILNDNSLTMNLPHPKIYDEFIQRLGSALNFVSTAQQSQEVEDKNAVKTQSRFNPKPKPPLPKKLEKH